MQLNQNLHTTVVIPVYMAVYIMCQYDVSMGATAEIWEWISNFIPYIIMDVSYHIHTSWKHWKIDWLSHNDPVKHL